MKHLTNKLALLKSKRIMKAQPKSTRQKVTMEEVNNALYILLCTGTINLVQT